MNGGLMSDPYSRIDIWKKHPPKWLQTIRNAKLNDADLISLANAIWKDIIGSEFTSQSKVPLEIVVKRGCHGNSGYRTKSRIILYPSTGLTEIIHSLSHAAYVSLSPEKNPEPHCAEHAEIEERMLRRAYKELQA